MKNLFTISGKVSMLVLILILGSGLTMAQSRYKHVPRVKVDVKHKQNAVTQKQSNKVDFHSVNETHMEANSETAEVIPAVVEETEVATVTEDPVIANNPVKQIRTVKPVKELKEKRKGSLDLFGDHFNIKSKLLKVKSVDKTQGTVGIILLIAFYVLSILFTVLCIVFLLDPNPGSFTLFLVFLILAIVFAIAGSIMLTLLKLGVI